MKARHPEEGDWQVFLELARQEGWRVPGTELALFRGRFAESAFALEEDGIPVAFVTAVSHGRNGWIGNLIVAPAWRGRGLGARLFSRALEVLEAAGVETVWLTASEQGRPLYERRNFLAVEEIWRWVRPASGERSTGDAAEGCDGLSQLLRADRAAWGESRRPLLEGLARGGKVLRFGKTTALLQGGDGMRVLGPWYGPDLCPRENRMVLTETLEATAGEIVLDVPGGTPVNRMLAAAGLKETGRTLLMVRGESAAGLSPGLVALASLGSLG